MCHHQIHAAQINNRHAKELEDAENLLADQVKQVSELQKEKRQLTELLAEREADLKKLQDNVGKFDDLSQIQSETKTATLMDGHSDDILSLDEDKPEARTQLFKALSRTETLVRLVLQQEGQPTITPADRGKEGREARLRVVAPPKEPLRGEAGMDDFIRSRRRRRLMRRVGW